MGTKKTTTTTNNYDPSSMTFFQSLQPQLQAGYKADLNIDPTQSPVFQLAMQNALGGVRQQNLRTISNLKNNSLFSSGTNMSPVQQSLLNTITRGNAAQSANAFIQNYLNYDTQRRQEQMQASGIKPLQTGQKSVEQTSGLGTWLPQVIGAGAQIGMGIATGGMSTMASGIGGAVGGAGALSRLAGGPGAATTESMPITGDIPLLSNPSPSLSSSSGPGNYINYGRF